MDEIIQSQSDLSKIVTEKSNKNLENKELQGIPISSYQMANYLKVIIPMILYGIANKYKQRTSYINKTAQPCIMCAVKKHYVCS